MSPVSASDQRAINRDVFLLACAAFASSLSLRLCDTLLPELARSFDTTVGQAAGVIAATGVAYGLFQLLFGPLGDHFGKFRVIAWACLASTVGAAASALSPDLDTLTLARALNGATTAALIPLAMAWIGDVVALEHRQATLARFMSGQILGLISGQALAGFFADHIGWRWAFAPLALIYFVVGLSLIRSLRGKPAGASTGSAGSLAGTAEKFRLVLANPHARFILLIVFAESMAIFGAMAFIPAFLHQRFDISLFHAGGIVATFGLGGLGYTLFARRWVRIMGQVRLAWWGGVLIAAALLLLIVAPGWGWGIVACTAAGLGFYQVHNTLQTLATQMTPAARGTAVSLFASCFFLGQASGVSIGALCLDTIGARWLFGASALLMLTVGGVLARYLNGSENMPN